MEYLTLERESFEYGAVDTVAPHIRRVIAENPSKFTYHGTGTYIVGRGDVAVIDPGPLLDGHRDALAAALDGETVRSILVTHCHSDHSPLAAWLRDESGAPTHAYGPHGPDGWDIGSLPEEFGRPPADGTTDSDPDASEARESTTEPKMEESTDRDFRPDHEVRTGDVVFESGGLTMSAIHTPGHTSNHTCFVLADRDGTTLFTGDHVMGWSTTVVSPPDGDMTAYIESLRSIHGRGDDVAIPTHGPPITAPDRYIGDLIEHRLERERQVLGAVRRGLTTIPEIVTELYVDVRIELHRPAGNSVLAHLGKLVDDGLITVEGRPRLDSSFAAV